MGTNYYAHIEPTDKQKNKLIHMIQFNQNGIEEYTKELYGKLYLSGDYSLKGGVVHLGKSSYGWKFLWNPNVFIKHNYELENHRAILKNIEPIIMYPLTREGIKSFIDSKDVTIYNEYGELQNKEEFWNFAINKEGYDGDTYEQKNNNKYYSSRYPETKLCFLLKELGCNMSLCGYDCYKDDLRFATSTDFS